MINIKENKELNVLNHSCAHLMAQAVKHLYPNAKFWVGPVIDEGFYYDIDLNRTAIFIDCREPEEIKKLCTTLNAKSLLITREKAENNNTSNHADQNVLNYNYDIIIQNNGDLREFAYTAIDFVKTQGLTLQPKPISVNLFGEIC